MCITSSETHDDAKSHPTKVLELMCLLWIDNGFHDSFGSKVEADLMKLTEFQLPGQHVVCRVSKSLSNSLCVVLLLQTVSSASQDLYISNYASGEIVRASPDGSTNVFAAGFDRPEGMAIDAQGNVYVVNNHQGQETDISKITPFGMTTILATGGFDRAGLTVSNDGDLYAIDYFGNSIDRITPQGDVYTFASGFVEPRDLAFDRFGNLFVANGGNRSISKVTPNGDISTFATNVLSAPYFLAFAASGNLFVSDESLAPGSTSMEQITPNGVVSEFHPGLLGAAGMAFDDAGNLFVVTVANDNKVLKITPGGIVSTFLSTADGLNNPEYIKFFPATTVPEPSSINLAVAALLVLLGAAYCRRRGYRRQADLALDR